MQADETSDEGRLPFLRDAALRFNRGRSHVHDLKARLAQWIAENPEPLRIRPNPPGGPTVESVPTPDMGEWKLLIGDAANDFRAALDYLVFELARLDSGAYGERTQFPVSDTRQHFNRARRKRLKGLSAEHVARIEKVQPYHTDGAWTRNLQLLSNPDKHRHLTKLGLSFARTFQASGPLEEGAEGKMKEVTEIHENPTVDVKLLLDDDVDAIAVLSEIQVGVYGLLTSFEEDFRRGE